jgi:hypothetical protein
MKPQRHLMLVCLIEALLLGSSVVVQAQPNPAQFTFTTNNGSITITGYSGQPFVLIIPSTINGFSVTTIGDNAFNGNVWLTSVTIPNSVTCTGLEAFYGCNNLHSITIGNGAISIMNYAFANCSWLTSITIPNSVATIGEYAFENCGLRSVTIGNGVTSIGNYGFYGCYSLTSLTIPSCVTNIGDYAFSGLWSSLAAVYFMGNAPSVTSTSFVNANPIIYYLPGTTGWDAFAQTTGLTTVLWNSQIQTSSTNFGVMTNQFGLNITGTSGLNLVVEACSDIGNPVWQPVQTNTLDQYGTTYFSDPQWTNYPNRFYRLRSLY